MIALNTRVFIVLMDKVEWHNDKVKPRQHDSCATRTDQGRFLRANPIRRCFFSFLNSQNFS